MKKQFICKVCNRRSWFKSSDGSLRIKYVLKNGIIVRERIFFKCPKCLAEGSFKYRRVG